MDDKNLNPNEDETNRYRGIKTSEYEIYKACASELGWPIKNDEEWLGS